MFFKLWTFLALASADIAASKTEVAGGKQFIVIGIPLSPLHSIVAIGQELCLRGHNVTVLSFGDRGLLKTRKFSPSCPLNYISLGDLPVNDETEQQTMSELAKTNNDTVAFLKMASKQLFQPYFASLHGPIASILATGQVKPDFALVSFPFGRVAEVLIEYNIDYAVNIPTVLVPPIALHASPYIPIPFYHVSPYNMTLFDRIVVIGGNTMFNFLRYSIAALGYQFSFLPDLNPNLWRGRLCFINSIPGLDYPQSLPPLVQYIGPVVDVNKMEAFPPEVEDWLEQVPQGKPVVYVSFGTVAYLSPERVRTMVNTLTSQHYHVLWALPKAQQSGLPETLPDSIKVHHWIPTQRALAHHKTVAFVSHCGGNSAAEAMALGVPIVGYPQFGDQPAVCQRIADAGAGLTGPPGGWVQANEVLEVVSNPSYAQRAESISHLFKHFGGVSKAADLLELGSNGHLSLLLTPPERSLNDYFRLAGYDIAVLGFASVCSFVYATRFITLLLIRKCCGRSNQKQKNQ